MLFIATVRTLKGIATIVQARDRDPIGANRATQNNDILRYGIGQRKQLRLIKHRRIRYSGHSRLRSVVPRRKPIVGVEREVRRVLLVQGIDTCALWVAVVDVVYVVAIEISDTGVADLNIVPSSDNSLVLSVQTPLIAPSL